MAKGSGWTRWWKRWFRRGRAEEYLSATPEEGVDEFSTAAPPHKRPLSPWPLSRRDRQLATLQEGYVEMIGLIRGIREHLEKQQGVQEKMIQVLDRLPASMEGLKNLGVVAEQQVETLSLLRQQMESAAAHDQQWIESMNHFNQTLAVMDQTHRASGRAVEQLVGKAVETEKMIRDVMARSERRFVILTVSFALLAMLILGTVLALFRVGRPGSGPRPADASDALPALIKEHPEGSAEETALPPGGLPVGAGIPGETSSKTEEPPAAPPEGLEETPAGDERHPGLILTPPGEKPRRAARPFRKSRPPKEPEPAEAPAP